jgi:hypothetical protein
MLSRLSPVVCYGAACLLLLVFAALHTFGFLFFVAPTPQGVGVFAAMNSTHFAIDGTDYSYGAFYRGFGLMITADQVFLAALAALLAVRARTAPRETIAPALLALALQLGGAALAWLYFGPPPMVFSLVIALLFASGALLARRVNKP